MIESEVDDIAPGPAFAFRGMAIRGAASCGIDGQHATNSGLRSRIGQGGAAAEAHCPVRELRAIGMSIPAFAIWQIATLERCFHRYCNILQLASRDVRFRRACVALMASAERISAALELVRSTNHWTVFNRAAFELRQDCEQLADLMDMG